MKPSGVLDDETRAAIRQYQSQHHLPVTGEPDKATLDKLGVVEQRSESPEGSQIAEETPRGQTMGGMGPGTMGQMPMASGMMMCPMMQMMGAHQGMGMRAMTGGHAMLYGMPHGKVEEMTPDRVRVFLAQRLEQHGNPRLMLGEIATAEDGSITADVVTVDGSLVQKLAFNRYPGLFRQVQ